MLPITVVEQCEEFVLIDKPAGIHMHSQHGQTGIIPILQEQLQCEQLWLVHRLDADTSGLLLLAKTQQAAVELSQLFQGRNIEKYYLAISTNKPQKKQGSVVGDMEPSRNGSYKLTKSKRNPAVTHFFSKTIAPGLRLFLLKPYTGQTHQLRVELKSISAAILGDCRYGGKSADRLYLHAFQLSFQMRGKDFNYCHLPTSGDLFNDVFTKTLETLTPVAERPWPDEKLRPLLKASSDAS